MPHQCGYYCTKVSNVITNLSNQKQQHLGFILEKVIHFYYDREFSFRSNLVFKRIRAGILLYLSQYQLYDNNNNSNTKKEPVYLKRVQSRVKQCHGSNKGSQ